MKISYQWLQDYVKCGLTPDEAAELLTSTGLEVEGVADYESVRGGLRGVVIGEVLSCEKHPNADRLTICRVATGDADPLTIVCGAPNVAPGQKVPVAVVGSVLYPFGREEGFAITSSTIRGVASEGMICAEDELGLGSGHDGIMVLRKDAVVGMEAADYFDIYHDTVLEIGLTPNRTDAMSHFGVARDLAACIGFREEKEVILTSPEAPAPVISGESFPVRVEIVDEGACKRYTGITLLGVRVAPSPAWLCNRLEAIGVKPHNNVVDITNYVLHELGHPLHAFDYDKLEGKTIVVQTVPEGTPFTTLDGVERKLASGDLMICDANNPLCIAGVYGGIGSGVTESTTRIFLESAWFDPVSVRRSARRHGLNTDASFRFERGADPNITVPALQRAVHLLCEITGATVASEISDTGPLALHPFSREVTLRHSRLNLLIGQTIPEAELHRILNLLGFNIIDRTDEKFLLEVPSYRSDVTREADVIEEVLRIYGMNNVAIPVSIPVAFPVVKESGIHRLMQTLSANLVHNGFFEAWNNSLTSSSIDEESSRKNRRVTILNPLSQELNAMRNSLLPALLENVRHNLNRKAGSFGLFEYGKIYHAVAEADTAVDVTSLFSEQEQLAFVMTGKSTGESWYAQQADTTLWDVKGVLFNLLRVAGVESHTILKEHPLHKHLNPAVSCETDGHTVAIFGLVSEASARKAGIKQPVWYAELYLHPLAEIVASAPDLFTPLPRYPDVRRDLSLVIDQTITYREIADLISLTAPNLVDQVCLFDVYESGNLPEGKKSYAIGITLRHPDKTLEEQEIETVTGKIVSALNKKLGAVLR